MAWSPRGCCCPAVARHSPGRRLPWTLQKGHLEVPLSRPCLMVIKSCLGNGHCPRGTVVGEVCLLPSPMEPRAEESRRGKGSWVTQSPSHTSAAAQPPFGALAESQVLSWLLHRWCSGHSPASTRVLSERRAWGQSHGAVELRLGPEPEDGLETAEPINMPLLEVPHLARRKPNYTKVTCPQLQSQPQQSMILSPEPAHGSAGAGLLLAGLEGRARGGAGYSTHVSSIRCFKTKTPCMPCPAHQHLQGVITKVLCEEILSPQQLQG